MIVETLALAWWGPALAVRRQGQRGIWFHEEKARPAVVACMRMRAIDTWHLSKMRQHGHWLCWMSVVELMVHQHISSSPSIVPVARCMACEIAPHTWEQPVVAAVCGAMPVPVIVPVFLAGTYRH